MKFLAAIVTTVALAVSAAPSLAASINLAALGLVQGPLLAQSDEVTVDFIAGFDLLEASVNDGTSFGIFDVDTTDPTTAFLNVTQPFSFAGGVVALDFDMVSAAALFFDGSRYVYGLLTLPVGAAFDFTGQGFTIADATAELYAVAPVPLPAAAPLLVAGLGVLAVAARRRRANRKDG
jgi:hypothetical protein